MTGKSITVEDIIGPPDPIARAISRDYLNWENKRQNRISEWKEIQQYIFSTSTETTANSSLPWSNKTTIPKLCQIRDNLFSYYMAALFPKRNWITWEATSEESATVTKRDTIENYMNHVFDRNSFYSEIKKLVLDYIDYGVIFGTPVWQDETDLDKDGYVGPAVRRISPLDIVFNPTAPDFESSPKIIRSFISLGELKESLDKGNFDTPEEAEAAQELFDKIVNYRYSIQGFSGEISDIRDDIYRIAGFDSYRDYLESNTVEVLTFYGDYYDEATQEYHKNKVIKTVDRQCVLGMWDNPSYFGRAPIFSVGWRVRPDTLWSMGPLDNLVGMQYRIDHLENMKADVFDLIAYPPLKIKGDVSDFKWGPLERIYVGDEGDVALMSPNTQAMLADTQIAILEAKMEEMAGSPKEAMGFRTPGEKTAYEVQRLEAASGRIFQNKIEAFERDFLEPLFNAMLELARRRMTATSIRVLDENDVSVFQTISASDIIGSGRIKPIAARNFAEKATTVQNLTSFFGSAAGQDPSVRQHFSSVELAKMWNEVLDIKQYNLYDPYIAIVEAGEQQRISNSVQQQVTQEINTPAGIMMGDDDNSVQPNSDEVVPQSIF